jgi:hypothetical protein
MKSGGICMLSLATPKPLKRNKVLAFRVSHHTARDIVQ